MCNYSIAVAAILLALFPFLLVHKLFKQIIVDCGL